MIDFSSITENFIKSIITNHSIVDVENFLDVIPATPRDLSDWMSEQGDLFIRFF